jgi:hypothetical protein
VAFDFITGFVEAGAIDVHEGERASAACEFDRGCASDAAS